MKIIIIGKCPYPHGFGLSVFTHNMAAGLSALGCTAKVMIVWPTEAPGKVVNTDADGRQGSVDFCYTCGRTAYPDWGRFQFLSKGWFLLYGIFALLRHLLAEQKRAKIDAIIISSPMSGYIVWLKLFTRIFHQKLIIYNGEYLACGQKVPYRRLPFLWIEKYFYQRLPDGMIVATGILEKFFKKYARRDCVFCRIPILLQTDAFPSSVSSGKEAIYLSYCGDMSGNKDGVEMLIRVFSIIAGEFPNYRLRLIGSTSPAEIARLQKICAEYEITDRVIFTGRLPHDQVIQALQDSAVLILTRPNNKQAEGGFPSKLGEYLFTGNPVLVSAVGEIPDVLTDRENVFLASPDDVDDFVRKLRGILSDLPAAQKVGQQGKKFALENFDYRFQCRKILDTCRKIQAG